MENYFYITPEDYIEAERNGICKDTLETRVRKLGWSVKRAKTEKVRKKHRISKELLEIAKANGIVTGKQIGRASCRERVSSPV